MYYICFSFFVIDASDSIHIEYFAGRHDWRPGLGCSLARNVGSGLQLITQIIRRMTDCHNRTADFPPMADMIEGGRQMPRLASIRDASYWALKGVR